MKALFALGLPLQVHASFQGVGEDTLLHLLNFGSFIFGHFHVSTPDGDEAADRAHNGWIMGLIEKQGGLLVSYPATVVVN